MSHFTVIVVGENIEEQLDPFNEQPEEGSPYLQFCDCTEEIDREWESMRNMLVLPDGTKKFRHEINKEILEQIGIKLGEDPFNKSSLEKYKDILDQHMKDIPISKLYRNKAHMARDYFGYRIHKNNGDLSFGYFHNPNAKWDWYQVGGRWTGYFKLKPVKLISNGNQTEKFGLSTAEIQMLLNLMYHDNIKFSEVISKYGDKSNEILEYLLFREKEIYPKTAKTGSPGVMTNPCIDPSRADQAYKRDIDFESMLDESKKKAEKFWDLAYPLEVNLRNAKTDKEKEEARRKLYDAGLIFGLSEDEFNMGREKYVECHTTVAPYALLWEGRWYSHGNMGWFGISTGEEPQWNGSFKELLEQIPDNQLLTLVDCHI